MGTSLSVIWLKCVFRVCTGLLKISHGLTKKIKNNVSSLLASQSYIVSRINYVVKNKLNLNRKGRIK